MHTYTPTPVKITSCIRDSTDGIDIRYHIGESLLPSVRHFLRFIDAETKVAEYGFARKVRS